MFRSARLKLTTWYLAIIMLVSISFSMIIYNMISTELERSLKTQRYRIYNPGHGISIPVPAPAPDPEVLKEAQNRLIWSLAHINAVILILSGIAGYILAGRTLRPIEEMVKDQNQFITDASHELRTPLTALKTSIEVNLRDENLTISEAREVLKSNLEEVDNLQTLSDGLINLSQHPKLDTENIRGVVQLKATSQEAVRKVIPMAQQKNITIVNEIAESTITGDQKSILELFVILLDNAIKYSSKETAINLYSKITDGKVVISIKDQGMGIAEEDISHIFDRFYRADKSRAKTDIPGYGLGLSIAKKTVTVHNGSISVKSTVGGGTQFTIVLPNK
ncbi:MAG: HAMP domain-containing histidine kinase [bacterium]|nr:HAMP domain-containing histidine kinase [bacterium]